MIYEKINLNIDIERLKQHLYEVVLPIGNPITQFEQFQEYKGWSVLSATGTYEDGWQEVTKCEEKIRGNTIFNYKKACGMNLRAYFDHKYPTEICTGYLAEVIQKLDRMGLYPRRGKIIVIQAGGRTVWHRDEPEHRYAVKLHIPIVTNTKCTFATHKGKKHMPADGSGYLVATNVIHQAHNGGPADRYHLVVEVWDTKHISKYFCLNNPREHIVQRERHAREFYRKTYGSKKHLIRTLKEFLQKNNGVN